jgi:hypothetical protein
VWPEPEVRHPPGDDARLVELSRPKLQPGADAEVVVLPAPRAQAPERDARGHVAVAVDVAQYASGAGGVGNDQVLVPVVVQIGHGDGGAARRARRRGQYARAVREGAALVAEEKDAGIPGTWCPGRPSHQQVEPAVVVVVQERGGGSGGGSKLP